jgi:myo-inositol 2-dehydrogenase / D-chiro-inositol 1-dehydrogenase
MTAASLSIGLLGAGRIGRVHAAAMDVVSGVTLVAVADAVPEAASALGSQHGVAVRTVEEILDDQAIDAVLIATPTNLHADLITAAAEAGKAIFCEKPIDFSEERTRACLDVVAQRGVPLMIGFNRRFDPNFQAVRAQIESGMIGDVEMVQIISRDPGLPPVSYLATSGGLFRDMTIHDFDMARFLLGEEPVSVFAVGSVLVDPEVASVGDIDSAAITLTTASGRIAQISNSRRAAYGYDQRIEVLGSKGMARADNIHESTLETATAAGYVKPPLMNFFLERYMVSYRRAMQEFVDSVSSGRAPSPSGNDGLRALLLADAAIASLASGAAVQVAAE